MFLLQVIGARCNRNRIDRDRNHSTEITVQTEAQGVVITVVIGIEPTVIEIATDWRSL